MAALKVNSETATSNGTKPSLGGGVQLSTWTATAEMRVLVLHSSTQHYLTEGPERWTANREEAYDFKTFVAAMQFCQTRGISGAVVMLAFADPAYDIALPLST